MKPSRRAPPGSGVASERGRAHSGRGGKKHEAEGCEVRVTQAIDVFTSAPWFDGFREPVVVHGIATESRPVIPARTWLLTKGWKRHGLLSVYELPASA